MLANRNAGADHPSYMIPMVLRTFELLDLLRTHPRLSVEELHARTGTAKSSVYRILRTLVATGHVTRERDGYYRYSASDAIDEP